MTRYDLTDEEFAILKPLLPPERPSKPGCPYRSHRQVLNGIFWILRTGAPWCDLPSRYGPWSTVSDRYRRWRKQGLWDQTCLCDAPACRANGAGRRRQVLDALEAQARQMNQIDFTFGAIDGSVVRAHKAAAGAKKT